METNKDIFEYYVRNEDLKQLIYKYSEKFPRDGNFEWGGRALPLHFILNNSFKTSETKEGELFWCYIVSEIGKHKLSGNPQPFIYEWKHYTRFLDNADVDRHAKDIITAKIANNSHNIRDKYYFAFDLSFAISVLYHGNYATIRNIQIINFAYEHNRFPNTFDE